MKNLQAAKTFQDETNSTIERLFWIAGCSDTREFRSLLEDIEEEEFLKLFNAPSLDDCTKEEFLYNKQKLGLLAEIHTAKCYNFSFNKKGRPESWSSNRGVCRISFVYAETLPQLMQQILKVDNAIFNEHVEKGRTEKVK